MNLGGQVNKVVNYTWKFSGANTMQARLRAIENIAAGAITAVAGAMTAITISSVNVAGAFREMENQFNVVFGDAAPRARDELNQFAEEIGRSGDRMLGFAASIQDTFVPLGLARDQAADLSVAAVQLATDLSSFKNLDTAQTVERITSALAGQHRAVQQLGIVINQEILAQELMNMGIEGGVQAATEAEKAVARYNIIVSASQDAIGDAARTSDEWTNQLRGLEDLWYDVRVEIGQNVIPILEELIPDVRDLITEFGEMASDAIPRVVDSLSRIAPVALDLIGVFASLTEALALAAEGWDKVFNAGGVEGLIEMANGITSIGFQSRIAQFGVWELAGSYQGARDRTIDLIDAGWDLVCGNREVAQSFDDLGSSIDDSIGGGEAPENTLLGSVIGMGSAFESAFNQTVANVQTTIAELDQQAFEHRIQLRDKAMNHQIRQAEQINNIMVSGANTFGSILKNKGEDFEAQMMRMLAQMALQFAQMQLGKSLGGLGGIGFGFLGGLI